MESSDNYCKDGEKVNQYKHVLRVRMKKKKGWEKNDGGGKGDPPRHSS